MNKLSTLALFTGVLALAISGVVAFKVFGHVAETVGASSPNCINGSVTCYTDLLISGVSYLGGETTRTNVARRASAGAVATGTSTLFSVANPFSATSTATIVYLDVVGQATSTAVYVGTSTASSGLVAADVSASLINAGVIATGTEATFISGMTTGLGTGQASSGSGSQFTIIVGPSERVSGFATSTYGGVGALNYSPAATSGTYKIIWQN